MRAVLPAGGAPSRAHLGARLARLGGGQQAKQDRGGLVLIQVLGSRRLPLLRRRLLGRSQPLLRLFSRLGGVCGRAGRLVFGGEEA